MSTAPPPGDAERDFVLAEQAKAAGDLTHAARHIACALLAAPLDGRYLAFAEELSRGPGDPLDLVPLRQEMFLADAVLRSYLLAKRDRFAEALDLLLDVVGAKPGTSLLSWALRWVTDESIARRLEPARLASSVEGCLARLNRSSSDAATVEPVLHALEAFLRSVRRVCVGNSELALVHAAVARRLHRPDLALEIGRALYAQAPGYHSNLILAAALRDLGRVEDAIGYLRDGLRFRPDDVAMRLDLGDTLLLAQRFEESAAAYQAVVDTEPRHPWAWPSLVYVRHRIVGGSDAIDGLEDILSSAPGNQRAQKLLDTITPYVGYLPPMAESSVNALRDFARTRTGREVPFDQPYDVKLRLSAPEAPSAKMAWDRFLARLHPRGRLLLDIGGVPEPDPRQPVGPVTWRLWSYDGMVSRPDLPPPSPSIASRIAEIAATDYQVERWKTLAKDLAGALGFAQTEAILATMIHPPEPAGVPLWDWIPRVQIAAALTLAWVDDGWDDSVRKRALLSLANGPLDWTSVAGVVALAELAVDTPDLSEVVGRLFVDLLNSSPSFGYWCLEFPLVFAALRLPSLPGSLRTRLRSNRTQLLSATRTN